MKNNAKISRKEMLLILNSAKRWLYESKRNYERVNQFSHASQCSIQIDDIEELIQELDSSDTIQIIG